jgi:hypothetical protein
MGVVPVLVLDLHETVVENPESPIRACCSPPMVL